MYSGFILIPTCFYSPFGWGATHPPIPEVNLILSFCLYAVVVLAGFRLLEALVKTKNRITWILAILLLPILYNLSQGIHRSLFLQITSIHFQFIQHMEILLRTFISLSLIVTFKVIQEALEPKPQPGELVNASSAAKLSENHLHD